MAKGIPPQNAQRMSHLQAAKLVVFMEENFTKSGLTDRDFARHASQHLGFPVLPFHVVTRRKSLGIPANSRSAAGVKLRVTVKDFEELSNRVARIEAFLQNTASTLNP